MQYFINSIGRVRSPYPQKFGIARQPGLVPAAKVCIELNTQFDADSVRGLNQFELIWVCFVFHDALDEGWQPLVRPPRLGGKQKMGVFATRSPHRPNHLGLSLLKLERIDTQNGVKLFCSGADLLDGTPVMDIKPYIPFVEAHPNAAAGFAPQAPAPLNVIWQPENICHRLPKEFIDLIEQSIAQDPRPAYQNQPERVYKMRVEHFNVHFRIAGDCALIFQLENVL